MGEDSKLENGRELRLEAQMGEDLRLEAGGWRHRWAKT